ncbi:MAG: dihydroorotate dehydrogenase [Thermovirgaceae bacterium]|jgi:dihydroorotate dehydrogenase (NAD+) catalytic subunit|nr:dihydroorotate dehydrogenase [Synergistales bacterium]MDI9392087.1 dihydroorotate dehydrogenase [Synergistota bacterium]NLV65707.1 dihydroorotate dehydrogenase [Synergistaceae bacterium]HRW87517.1 dihydroorotate dehydrogenase [Thermovirgaceae bacterium]MDD3134763.1 dihydroorotate dehydrogenase [Synergistales bacterium]
MESSLRTNVGGVNLETPVIVASGVWPMDPRLWPAGSMEGVGAVCSKGMTFEPREGNRGFRIMETYAGILNSIGLQNYGVEHFIAKELPLLDNSCRPVIVNIAFETLEDLRRILERLKVCRSMVGVVEMNVSCPNVSRGGLSWGVHTESLGNAVSMARQVWEGPLWVKLSPQVPSMGEFARLSQECGAQAVVVGNTWLGMAIDNDLERPFFENVFAGLSGPAIFPLALRAVWEAAGAVNIPVIGCGGIARPGDALSMILAGASAVEVGTALFIDSGLPASICRELEANLTKKGLASVRELVGRARNDQGENGEKSR